MSGLNPKLPKPCQQQMRNDQACLLKTGLGGVMDAVIATRFVSKVRRHRNSNMAVSQRVRGWSEATAVTSLYLHQPAGVSSGRGRGERVGDLISRSKSRCNRTRYANHKSCDLKKRSDLLPLLTGKQYDSFIFILQFNS